jgi:hypothetical protein
VAALWLKQISEIIGSAKGAECDAAISRLQRFKILYIFTWGVCPGLLHSDLGPAEPEL